MARFIIKDESVIERRKKAVRWTQKFFEVKKIGDEPKLNQVDILGMRFVKNSTAHQFERCMNHVGQNESAE